MITIYKKSNGEITKICNCPEADIPFQYDPIIESYIEGSYAYNSYYIQDSQAIAITNAPDQYHIFNYDTKQWYDPRTITTQWPIIKAERDQLLKVSDWTQLPDVTLTNKEAWAIYRQALRDITNQSDPFNIVWPTAPGA